MKGLLLLILAVTGTLRAEVAEESVIHAGVKFRVVRLAPARVSLVWKDARGLPYRSFDKVQAAFARRGKTVSFIMNAGIFEPGGIPSGLHVEDGQTLNALNLADAPGNFFLKPNGVVWIEAEAGREAFIGTPQRFMERGKQLRLTPSRRVEIAAQSGPLLLIDGRRHPAFRENSKSELVRNGVGVDGEKRLVFAKTDQGQLVNLWGFAGLFLKLDCKDALFLDGDISQMAVNPKQPVASNQFGAMFVVAE